MTITEMISSIKETGISKIELTLEDTIKLLNSEEFEMIYSRMFEVYGNIKVSGAKIKPDPDLKILVLTVHEPSTNDIELLARRMNFRFIWMEVLDKYMIEFCVNNIVVAYVEICVKGCE